MSSGPPAVAKAVQAIAEASHIVRGQATTTIGSQREDLA